MENILTDRQTGLDSLWIDSEWIDSIKDESESLPFFSECHIYPYKIHTCPYRM